MKRPFYSIIVVTRNAGEKLTETIESIRKQTFTDPRIRLIRGRDGGIYDGMNIAVRSAGGQVFYFLNTGDYLFSETVLADAADKIRSLTEGEEPSLLVLYGDVFERRSGQTAAANPVMDDFALFRNVPCHQACFYSRDLFDGRGFDTALKVRADYEHFLYCHYKRHARMYYLPETIADYEGGGFSEENRKLSAAEHRAVTQMYMPAGKVLKYRLAMALTLQPVREKIASNPKTAGFYDRIKSRMQVCRECRKGRGTGYRNESFMALQYHAARVCEGKRAQLFKPRGVAFRNL